MLQQTQVATALPYYQTFIARFPSVASLARARKPQVLARWSGLGYYRRAVHLLEAARRVVREHDGRIPSDPERFARLPGVGRYTAGAVLSIAFGKALPVLDGNVARVLCRLFALRSAGPDPGLWRLAEILVPRRGAGEWNQALMELGALVCLPRGPRCDECPLRSCCRAHALARVEEFPAPRRRPATVRLRRAVALIERAGRVLMVRRRGALLDGLWEPPGVEVQVGQRPRARLAAELARLGLDVRLAPTGRAVRHRITHREIEVEVWRGRLAGPPPRASGARLVGPRSGAPLSGLARRLTSATFRLD
jgi:A/G-specific adenine glycosylase